MKNEVRERSSAPRATTARSRPSGFFDSSSSRDWPVPVETDVTLSIVLIPHPSSDLHNATVSNIASIHPNFRFSNPRQSPCLSMVPQGNRRAELPGSIMALGLGMGTRQHRLHRRSLSAGDIPLQACRIWCGVIRSAVGLCHPPQFIHGSLFKRRGHFPQ